MMERAQEQRWRNIWSIQGVHQVQKQKAFSGLSLGSCFNPDGTPIEEKELERSSSVRSITTPRGLIQSEYFGGESNSKGISQTVISRLKNLEGLQSFWNLSGRRKKISGNDKRRDVSISGEINDGECQFKSSSYPQNSLYAWDDMEESRYIESRVSSRWSETSVRTKIESSITQNQENWSHKPLLDGHFRDIKVDPVSTLRSHRTASKSLDSGGSRDISSGYSPPPIRKDRLLLEPGYCPAEDVHFGLETAQIEKTNEENKLPKSIMVFKPNVGGALEALYRSKNALCNEGSPKGVPSNSRATRQIRGEYYELDAKSSGFRRYLQCENSCCAYCGDFNGEMEMLKLPYKGTNRRRYTSSFSTNAPGVKFRSNFSKLQLRGNKWCRYPSSSSVKPPSSMIDDESILESWKLTDRFRVLEIVDFGNKSGEMLAMPDREAKLKSLSTGRSKDKTYRASCRSRSRLILGRKSRTRTLARSNITPQYKPPSPYSSTKTMYPSSENEPVVGDSSALFELKMEANVKDFFKQKGTTQIPSGDITEGNLRSDDITADVGCKAMSLEFSKMHPMQSSVTDNEKIFIGDPKDACNNQGNPNRLPEGGFPLLQTSNEIENTNIILSFEMTRKQNKASGSEYVKGDEIKDADVQENPKLLCTQPLQNPPNLSGHFHSNKEFMQIFSFLFKDIALKAEGWELSYAVKVLAQSGIEKSGLNKFRAMWHSPYSPLNPSLFYSIEKTYSDEMVSLRSERMLIFDNINTAILKYFRQHVDVYPWVEPKFGHGNSSLVKWIQQEYVNGNGFNPDMVWGGSKREIDAIGKEIETLLTDEMVSEFVCEQKRC